MGRQFFTNNENAIRATFPNLFVDFGSITAENTNASFIDFFEWLTALMLLVAVSPVMLLCAIAIKLTSKGDIFYSQQRVGQNGQVFNIYKFRSMITNAEKDTGPVLSSDDDPRVTLFGRFMRKTHIDELPQIFNILSGDMLFIGPRPERPEFVNQFNETIFRYRSRAVVKPGITGLAQVCCGYDATAEEKLKFDLLYLKYKPSLRMNITILYYTAKKVFFAWSQNEATYE